MPMMMSMQPARSSVLARHPCAQRAKVLRKVTVQATKTPSNGVGANSLEVLKRHTTVLLDSTLSPDKMTGDATTDAGVVNMALLSHILANTSTFQDFENAIEKGVSKAAAESPGDSTAAMLNALTNVALMLQDRIAGKIAIEVDIRLADDQAAMEAQAQQIVDLCNAQGLSASKLLLQLPGTWAGLQAAAALQSRSVDCEVVSVYSLAQAAKAVAGGVAVVRVNITRVNLWYASNPGAIRDPHGPRQDAGAVSDINMGVRTAAQVYAYSQRNGGQTKVVATGIRTPNEALALSGVDYMILPDDVSAGLTSQGTLAGYNDGLSGAGDVEGGQGPALSAEVVAQMDLPEVDSGAGQAEFASEMGMVGQQLLEKKIRGDQEATANLEKLLTRVVVARE